MPEEGISLGQLIECYHEIVQASTNFDFPSFLGFPDAANSVPALGAAMLVPLINQNMCNQDIQAPSATFVEMEVVHWLRQQLGYLVPSAYTTVTEIGGVLTVGGCLSNSYGLMVARESLFPGSGLTGLPAVASKIRVLIPDVIEHYSIRSAMAWLGMGEANVVRVPVDDVHRMIPGPLELHLDEERAVGNRILACIAYAGDSRGMRIDNLDQIGEILRKYKVWFHVDACHGSQLAFSSTHRHKIRGIEKADSVTIDPHKVLFIPYQRSFALFKDPKSLANVSTNSDLILKTQWSLGQITPCIGSKAFDALKLWSTIKYFGRSGIETLIDTRLQLTKDFQEEIIKNKYLLLLNDTDINSCIFIFMPHLCQGGRISAADLEKLNRCNTFIKTSINESGDVYVHGFNLKECPNPLLPEDKVTYVLQTINGNPLTTIGHLRKILDTIVTLGHQFFHENQYYCVQSSFIFQSSTVFRRLKDLISGFMKQTPYTALIYGSSALPGNYIRSDVDVMVFSEDHFHTTDNVSKLKSLICQILVEENIPFDIGVPLERKLLIPLSFAMVSSDAVPFV